MASQDRFISVETQAGTVRVQVPPGLPEDQAAEFAKRRAAEFSFPPAPPAIPQGNVQFQQQVAQAPEKIGGFLQGLPRTIAAAVPQTVGETGGKIVGATLGGLTGGPVGAGIGAVLGGGVGAGLGESYDQIMAHIDPKLSFTPAPETSMEAAGRIANAIAFGMVGGAAPVGGVGGAFDATLGVSPKLTPQASFVPKPGQPREVPVALGGTRDIFPATLAARFGINLTPAQRSQGSILSSLEGIFRRSLFAGNIFKKADVRTSGQLNAAATRLFAAFKRGDFTQAEMGTLIQETIEGYNKGVGTRFGLIFDNIVDEVGDITLDSEDIYQAAKGFLKEFNATEEFTSLRTVESLNKAINILEEFAGGGGPRITLTQAKSIRHLLYVIGHSGEVDTGKGAIQQLTKAVHEGIISGLDNVGRPDLGADFVAASTKVAEVKKYLDTAIIREIRRTDSPQVIASLLLNPKTAESNNRIIRELVKNPRTRERLQGSLLEEMFRKSREEESFIGNTLNKFLTDLSPESKRALFPNAQHLDDIKDFVDLVDTIDLPTTVREPISSASTSLLGFGEFGAIREMATVAIGGFILSGGNLYATFLGGAGLLLTPPMIAKLMTNPKTTNMMLQIAKTPRDKISNRLLLAFGTQVLAQSQERKPGLQRTGPN